MIVDYFPFGKVLGGRVAKLAVSNSLQKLTVHETWKRSCPSSPSFQVQLEKNCRKHDEKWSFLRFMCLMYTFREVIPHNSGTCRKLLGGFKVSPPNKNVQFDLFLYHWGIKPHLCSFVVPPTFFGDNQKDPTFFLRPPFVVWAHPAPLQACLERFLGDSALVLFHFWAVEHGSWGGGVCVFVFQWPQERAGL